MTDNQVYSILAAILFIIVMIPFFYLAGYFDRGPNEGEVYEHVVHQNRYMVQDAGNCRSLHNRYDRWTDEVLDDYGHLGLDVVADMTSFPFGEDSPDKECVAFEQRQMVRGENFRIMYMLSVEDLREEYTRVK